MKVKRLHIVLMLTLAVYSVSALADNHREAVSLMLQGVQALEEGKSDFAKKSLCAAETLDPEDDAIQYYLGYIAASESDANSALKHFEAAWKKDSTNYWYGVRLGKVYTIMNKFAQAKRINDILLSLHPNDAEVMSYAVDLALREGELEKADSLLNRIDILMGPSEYSRMTRLEILRQRGDFTNFFKDLNHMYKDPQVPGKVKKELLESMIGSADPRFNFVHIADYDSLLTTCIRVHPTDTSVLHYAVGFYYTIKNYSRVIKICDTHPGDGMMAIYKMFSCWSLKDYARTLDACDYVIKLSKEPSDILSAVTTKADCYQQMNSPKAAFREYERALKISPNDPVVLNNYAYYLSVLGYKLSKAAKMSRKVIQSEPENETYLDTYGWILYKQKKYADAKVYLKKALLYGGKENAEVLEHYAAVLEALGETSLAEGYRQQAKLRSDGAKK